MSIIKISIVVAAAFIFISCKEGIVDSDVQGTPKTFLTIVNAVAGSGTLVYSGYPADSIVNNSTTASVTSPRRYVFDGTSDSFRRVRIYSKYNAAKVYFDSTINFENGKSYSLFLGGDTVVVAKVFAVESESFYSSTTDSTARVRFVNIAKNSPTAVNVTLSMTPIANEFVGVAYGGITPLKTYGATAIADPTSRTFQVRNAASPSTVIASGIVITSTARFAMATVIFRGVVGRSAGVTVVYY